MRKVLAYIIFFGLAALFFYQWGRVKQPPVSSPFNALRPVHPVTLTDDLDQQSLLAAINQSIEYFKKTELNETVQFGPDPVPRRTILLSLIDLEEKLRAFGLGEMFYNYLSSNYRFYQSSARSVLFTGYYEAHLRGSLKRSDVFSYPLYTRPHDMYTIDLSRFRDDERFKGVSLRGRIAPRHRIVPYYSRDEIDFQKRLEGRCLELVWVDDPIELFFLHIQGSGIVTLEDGSRLRVGYADANGHPYQPIGKHMAQLGLLPPDSLNMQSIRAYLKEHPEQLRAIFNYNPSYVFFRKVDDGPLGSIGAKLTPLRSIATDSRLFPRGALALIETEKPVFDEGGRIIEWKKFMRLALNQDTGGAIKGPGRVDLFTGFGKEAEAVAGHMKQEGMLYFLVKNTST